MHSRFLPGALYEQMWAALDTEGPRAFRLPLTGGRFTAEAAQSAEIRR